jgi:hypothetical protein
MFWTAERGSVTLESPVPAGRPKVAVANVGAAGVLTDVFFPPQPTRVKLNQHRLKATQAAPRTRERDSGLLGFRACQNVEVAIRICISWLL